MSYNIENLSFTIFGSGHDGSLPDSGEGFIEPVIRPLKTPNFGAFSSSGECVWLCDGDFYQRKFKIDTWEEVPNSLPKGYFFHPNNVENNIGIIFASGANDYTVTLFNLDDDTIIKQFTGTHKRSTISDCIMVGDDDFYMVGKTSGISSNFIFHMDIANETTDSTPAFYGCSCGFVDNDTIYDYLPPTWYTDPTYIYGYSFSAVAQWSSSSSGTGGNAYPYVSTKGICRNGYIYVPTLDNGVWRMGEYDGNTVPDFETPTPIRTFGQFESKPELDFGTGIFRFEYSTGREIAVFCCNLGMFKTDFNTISKITDETALPVAVSKDYVVTQYGINQVKVYKI